MTSIYRPNIDPNDRVRIQWMFSDFHQQFASQFDLVYMFFDYLFDRNIYETPTFTVEEYLDMLLMSLSEWWKAKTKKHVEIRANILTGIDLTVDDSPENMAVDEGTVRTIENLNENTNNIDITSTIVNNVGMPDETIENVIETKLEKYFKSKAKFEEIESIPTLVEDDFQLEENDLEIIMPELILPENEANLTIRKQYIRAETFYGADYGRHWWSQSYEKVFLHVDLSDQVDSSRYLHVGFTKNKTGFFIRLKNENTWKVLVANKFHKSFQNSHFIINNKLHVKIILEKTKREFWNKCLITETKEIKNKLMLSEGNFHPAVSNENNTDLPCHSKSLTTEIPDGSMENRNHCKSPFIEDECPLSPLSRWWIEDTETSPQPEDGSEVQAPSDLL